MKTDADKDAEVVHALFRKVESMSQQLQDARAWAALWKRAAKRYRHRAHRLSSAKLLIDGSLARLLCRGREYEDFILSQDADIAAKDAEIERLRGLLVRIVNAETGKGLGAALYHAVNEARAALEPADD